MVETLDQKPGLVNLGGALALALLLADGVGREEGKPCRTVPAPSVKKTEI
jgi:hypothetical protein